MIPCAMHSSVPATLCCVCKFPPVPICPAHLQDHALHQDSGLHFPLPLSAINWLSTKNVYYQCKDWLSHLQNAYREAANNVDSMQRCSSDLSEKMTVQPRLLLLLVKNRVDILVAAFQAELQAAIDATSAHALEDFQFEEGSLSCLIRKAAILTDYEPLELFAYQQEVPSFEIKLASLAAFNQPMNIDPELESLFRYLQEQVEFLTQENAQLRVQSGAEEVESLRLEIQQLAEWENAALERETRLRAENEDLRRENAELKETDGKWRRRVQELEAEALLRKAPESQPREVARPPQSLSLPKAGEPGKPIELSRFVPMPLPTPTGGVPRLASKPEESKAKFLPARTEVAQAPATLQCPPPVPASSESAPQVPSATPPLKIQPITPISIDASRDLPSSFLSSSSTSSIKSVPEEAKQPVFSAPLVDSVLLPDSHAPAQYGELYIRDALGVKRTLDYSSAFTVENLKYKLASMCFIPVDQQLLSYGSQELEDVYTLEHYGVAQKAELCLSKRSAKLCKSFYVQSSADLFAYDYKPYLKFGEVKRLIETDYAIPVDTMTLKSGERILDDEYSLKDYNIQRGCTIYLHVEARLFTVRIRPPQGPVFPIKGSYLTTVREVKELVEKELGLSREMQEILRETTVLEDAQSFVSAKVKANMTLELKYKPIQLIVKLENDQDVSVSCMFNTSIKSIKQCIAEAGHCPADLQRLTYAEEELNEEKTVGVCGLRASSVLRLYQGCKDRQEVLVRLAEGRTTVLEYDPEALVGQVRDAALRKMGVEVEECQMKYAGKLLNEKATLASEYVQRGGTLYLTAT